MAGNEIQIELRPHVGKKNTPLGPVEIVFDQWYVIASRGGADPKQVGYMQKSRDGVQWLVGTRERLGDWLAKQVEAAATIERNKLLGIKPAEADKATDEVK
jgi:hypothetical protein